MEDYKKNYVKITISSARLILNENGSFKITSEYGPLSGDYIDPVFAWHMAYKYLINQ